jgi:3'-phosphoadenosine 5'-phosphosulfate sulfotransferase (PAPS reductase)/FAD synthetase
MTTSEPTERSGLGVFPDLDRASAENVLRWALDKFSPQIALACSFQAEESALIDMIHHLRGGD